MPIFEYYCGDCDRQFEELVTSDNQIVNCPGCNSDNVTKLLSVFAASTGDSVPTDFPCGRPNCNSGFT